MQRRHASTPTTRSFEHNLPSSPTSFVGREHLLADVWRLLASTSTCRLLTLTGPGGTGKTRVALEAGAAMLDQFPDGVCFVGLAALSDPRLVAWTIAQSLRVADNDRLPALERLKSYLVDRRLLLILDNFEQVLSAAVEVGELLAACPRLKVMVTSRAPLRLSGEQELAVPPLSLPDESNPPGGLEESESVRLFVARARAVKVDFVLSPGNAVVVAEICRRLDGLPLAIELAAARTRLLEPASMLARLEHRLHLLTGGARDAPARQQTLRNTIAWSYDLLTPEEQSAFRSLAVFVGGCSLEAAAAVCAGSTGEIVDLLDSLVAWSLLRPMAGAPGDVRVSMFETIREFGLEQLAWSGELDQMRRRHAEYFLALAEEGEPGLGGPNARTWLDRLELEHDNLRAALEWSLGAPGKRADTGLRLSGALGRFWWMSGHFGEGRRWLTRSLAAAPGAAAARMKALHGAGWLAHMERDGTAAHRALQASLAIAEQLHDQWWQAWILHALGRVAYFDNDARQARQHGQQSLVIAETLGDEWLRAWALHLLGLAAYIGHDYPSAEAYYAQALAIRRELGHLEGIVIVLILKGMIPHRGGDLPAALALYREALELARELNSAWFIRSALPHLASLAADRHPERAARLGGAVTGMSESSHTLPIPVTEALFNEGIQTARRRLGETAFAQAWADGRAMSSDAIIAEALAIEVAPRGPYPAQLTAAEVEVLRRLASGCSTRQIAAELVIAISTVDRHITHIYEKIGRRGRAFATAFALEHGLAEGNPSNSRPT